MAALEPVIERALQQRFGFRVPVLVRDARELCEEIEGLPFSPEQIERERAAEAGVVGLHAVFLSAPPSPAMTARQEAPKRPGETFVASGRLLYARAQRSRVQTVLPDGQAGRAGGMKEAGTPWRSFMP